jgi:hypothetical protein
MKKYDKTGDSIAPYATEYFEDERIEICGHIIAVSS